MAHRRVGSRSFARPAPRSMIWIGMALTTQTLAGGSKDLMGSLSASALLLRPFTVVRTRINFLFESDATGTSERTHGAVGLIVVKDQASAAGVASVPGPITDTDGEWMMYQPLLTAFVFRSAVGANSPFGDQYVVDSKAQRKVGNNEDLIQVAELTVAAGAFLTSEGRMLIKLH